MKEFTHSQTESPAYFSAEGAAASPRSVLDEIARTGAQQMLQAALEQEVSDYIEQFKNVTSTDGRRAIVRNGYLPSRDLVSGVGPLTVKQPRVRDKSRGHKFSSKLLPPFLRRLPSIDTLLPILYLKGISSGDFSEALESVLGKQSLGLSSTNIMRLMNGWTQEHELWSQRSLEGKSYPYIWVDGVYFNVRGDAARPCLLVIMGANEEGKKELIAVKEGQRESKLSWKSLLCSLKSRGWVNPPRLAIGDGALGFWGALAEEFPDTERQRCWVHKTRNLLDKLPKSVQPEAKEIIHEMSQANDKESAKAAYERFIKVFEDKHERAVTCLRKDEDDLFGFYDFPAKHWKHIRTTNPIESTFATVKHRQRKTKNCGSPKTTVAMAYKLCREAEKKWRRLKGWELIPKVALGIKFPDGCEPTADVLKQVEKEEQQEQLKAA